MMSTSLSPSHRRLLALWSGAIALALTVSPLAAQVPDEVTTSASVDTAPSYATVEYEWSDPLRGRAVPVRLYLPVLTDPGMRIPLVVFSHGIGGSRRGYSYLGNHFAANGIASLHVQHVGSDRALWLGNPFSLVGRLHDAAQEREAINRVLDLRFALDQLLAGEHGLRVDRTQIVVAGHSYGANTALLAAGARVERDGRVLEFRDPRFSAAILISAPPFYGESEPARILKHVTVPTLHITATDDVIQIPGYYSGANDRVTVFEATGSTRKTLAVFAGGSHSIFTDRAATGGAQLNAQVKAATRELTLAFVTQLFSGAGDAIERWSERYRPIVARIVTAPLR
jgi:pimeloyl-ACP methyl ester carboxylesterase